MKRTVLLYAFTLCGVTTYASDERYRPHVTESLDLATSSSVIPPRLHKELLQAEVQHRKKIIAIREEQIELLTAQIKNLKKIVEDLEETVENHESTILSVTNINEQLSHINEELVNDVKNRLQMLSTPSKDVCAPHRPLIPSIIQCLDAGIGLGLLYTSYTLLYGSTI